MNQMRSLTFRAIGNLAHNPEVVLHGKNQHTRFRLLISDYYGQEGGGQGTSYATSAWFMAGDDIGVSIAKEGREGDQLFVEGLIVKGPDRDNCAFVVLGYRFGAKQLPPGAAESQMNEHSPQPHNGAASGAATVVA